jgi:hypothetical protein
MNKDWPCCGREVHLHGGLLAINEPMSDEVRFWPPKVQGNVVSIKILSYHSLHAALQARGLQIVGTEFITHELEASGAAPTQWRSYSDNAQEENWEACQRWSQISNAAFHHRNGVCYDLSSRISYQLESSSQRLKELSYSYRDQLKAIVLNPNSKLGRRLQDGFTNIVYQRFQSFLFDICILRDYLCEFVYIFSSTEGIREEGKNATTAGALLKRLQKNTTLNDIEVELKEQMDNGGWIKELGAYRDLVMHSAPINIPTNSLYCIEESHKFTDAHEIQSVRFPVPSNPEGIFKERAKRENFDKYINEIDAISRRSLEEDGEYDCLQYAHTCLVRISSLSLMIAAMSPYAPMERYFILTPEGAIPGFRQI